MVTDALLYPASITPFNDAGVLDPGLVDEYHLWLESSGVDGIFTVGTTGEFIALDDSERTLVIASAVKVFGTERVIAHTGAPSLRQAARLTAAARDVGATRFAAMTPYFEVAHPAALLHYYAELSRIGEGETWAYHFPSRTTVSLPPEQVWEIATEVGLAGAKVSGLPAEMTLSYVAPGFDVFTGNDVTFAECVRGGAVGAVSGMSAAFPAPFVALRDALRDGDDAAVAEAQGGVQRVVTACEGVNFALIKQALTLQGIPAGPVRVALDAPTREQVAVLEDTLDFFGIPRA